MNVLVIGFIVNTWYVICLRVNHYRPQTKLRQGNIFVSVCQEFCHREARAWWGGGHAWQGVCGRRDGHCCGRYASYWNAFLFSWEYQLQSDQLGLQPIVGATCLVYFYWNNIARDIIALTLTFSVNEPLTVLKRRFSDNRPRTHARVRLVALTPPL